MDREAYKKLKSWRDSSSRKPLLLRGVRHVGKTWLLHEFGRHEYDRMAYVDFSRQSTLREVFSGSYSGRELLLAVQLQLGVKLYPKRTLIVLDEIQEVPDIVGVLARLREETPEFHIIAAESRVAHTYPVGQGLPSDALETMFLRPMSYTEFLRAVGKTELADFLETRDWKMLTHFHDDYVSQLIMYCLIGGMPNVVHNFVKRQDFRIVRTLQENILRDYQESFARLARKGMQKRLSLLWDSLPRQLDCPTHKFRYNAVAPGLGARELERPMTWLVESGFVRQIPRVTTPELPLEAHRDGSFKGYLLDIGLLTARLDLPMTSFLETSRLFDHYHGTLAEQIVQQEMAASVGEKPHYWSAPRGNAEADFLLQSSGMVIPVDVTGIANPRAKKLAYYCEKFHPPVAVRISLSKYQCRRLPMPGRADTEYTLIDLPLYAVSQLATEIQSALDNI
ncbi:MAG: ATP-binding protein [Victivallales bacterium]|nr:ATP-binding protein [Victivallales bacterium]